MSRLCALAAVWGALPAVFLDTCAASLGTLNVRPATGSQVRGSLAENEIEAEKAADLVGRIEGDFGFLLG